MNNKGAVSLKNLKLLFLEIIQFRNVFLTSKILQSFENYTFCLKRRNLFNDNEI